MGIFGALTTAVTGLRAQSFALENISGNIANSQTTAFKRVDTSFEDLIPNNIPSKQLAGTVTSNSIDTNTVQGDFQSSSIAGRSFGSVCSGTSKAIAQTRPCSIAPARTFSTIRSVPIPRVRGRPHWRTTPSIPASRIQRKCRATVFGGQPL